MDYDFAIQLLRGEIKRLDNLRSSERKKDYALALELLEKKQAAEIEEMKADEIEDMERWLIEGDHHN